MQMGDRASLSPLPRPPLAGSTPSETRASRATSGSSLRPRPIPFEARRPPCKELPRRAASPEGGGRGRRRRSRRERGPHPPAHTDDTHRALRACVCGHCALCSHWWLVARAGLPGARRRGRRALCSAPLPCPCAFALLGSAVPAPRSPRARFLHVPLPQDRMLVAWFVSHEPGFWRPWAGGPPVSALTAVLFWVRSWLHGAWLHEDHNSRMLLKFWRDGVLCSEHLGGVGSLPFVPDAGVPSCGCRHCQHQRRAGCPHSPPPSKSCCSAICGASK